jgi:chemotaxis regulatin CheY-phosphate phosphatase CheZ
MAGRPVAMAKKVAALEELAYRLYSGLADLRPKQYAERAEDFDDDEEVIDDICERWNWAVENACEALDACQSLLQMLEEKAKLPHRELWRERLRARGGLVENAEAVGT